MSARAIQHPRRRQRHAQTRRIEIIIPATLIAVASLTLLVRMWLAPAAWAGVSPSTLHVNINTATATELRLLPGVGPALARKIVSDRTADGPFPSISALDRVKGIGPRTIQKIAPFITADADLDAPALH